MKLLFICSRNRRRSPTAEAVFCGVPGYEALSAGTAVDADTPLSADLLLWADVIFAMQAVHKRRLLQQFPQLMKGRRLIVLGIEDKYDYMDSELIITLRRKVAGQLGMPRE